MSPGLFTPRHVALTWTADRPHTVAASNIFVFLYFCKIAWVSIGLVDRVGRMEA